MNNRTTVYWSNRFSRLSMLICTITSYEAHPIIPYSAEAILKDGNSLSLMNVKDDLCNHS